MHYLYEAILVGLIMMIIGYPITYLFMYINDPDFVFDHKNAVLLNFFVVGFVAHIILELIGINKMYCQKGYACNH